MNEGRTLRGIERDAIKSALDQNAWDFKATATSLGISRTALYAKIKRHKLSERNADKFGRWSRPTDKA